MIEEKRCKGTGKAAGFDSCGELVPVSLYGKANRVYGLGKSCGCYQKWLLSTDAGRAKLSTTITRAFKKVKREEAQKATKERMEWRKRTTIELMTANKYRSTVLQPVINEIARLIDYGQPCIATGNYGKENGGHYISVGANVTISLNLHNIHIQSFESNHFKSGDTVNYQNGICKIYGCTYLRFMDSLNSCEPLKLNKEELIEITVKAKEIRKSLKENIAPRTNSERVALRNEINLKLGIYPYKHSVFKNNY